MIIAVHRKLVAEVLQMPHSVPVAVERKLMGFVGVEKWK